MFKNNMVAAIKVAGKVLREFNNNTVYVPFGSEYSILLKNLDTFRKVSVSVRIDGEDALDGVRLIIDPGQSIDLKRFIRNGNLNDGNAFKFIEKTDKIEKYRGNRAEDGLITIHYEFENQYARISSTRLTSVDRYRAWAATNPEPMMMNYEAGILRNNERRISLVSNTSYSCASVEPLTAKSTAGITAPGSITSQKFSKSYGFYGDGIHHSLTLKLEGLVDGQVEVKEPVVVKKLKRCKMCGTNVKQVAKFCHECGSSVEIV